MNRRSRRKRSRRRTTRCRHSTMYWRWWKRGATEIIALAQDLVRFNTVSTGVMPTGNETPAAAFLAAKFAAEGIPSEVVESAPGRGNVVSILAGTGGSDRSFALLGHTDVVPVEDEKPLDDRSLRGGDQRRAALWARQFGYEKHRGGKHDGGDLSEAGGRAAPGRIACGDGGGRRIRRCVWLRLAR